MDGDICPACDGTGERDFLSGARCYECNGTGWREYPDDDDYYEDEPDWLSDVASDMPPTAP